MERLIEERREQIRREKELEILEWREGGKREKERRAIIEQERQKLLREHASKLLGYLPKVINSGTSDTLGTQPFVLYREVVLFWRLFCMECYTRVLILFVERFVLSFRAIHTLCRK